MRRPAAIIILVVLAIGAAGVWRWWTVEGTSRSVIKGSGIIEVTEVDVAFQVPGTIAERYVDEGALLDKGEPIARLDDQQYRLEVERAAAAKAAAEARYRRLLKGPRGQEIDQALAALEAADSELATQQRELNRIKTLYAAHVVSRAEFDQVN
ncbi:MAG: HlyD family secretion protein, partial [Candidatus Binatia bacterium]